MWAGQIAFQSIEFLQAAIALAQRLHIRPVGPRKTAVTAAAGLGGGGKAAHSYVSSARLDFLVSICAIDWQNALEQSSVTNGNFPTSAKKEGQKRMASVSI